MAADPMLADALVGIGRAHVQRGAIDDARLALSRAAQIDPESPRLKAAQDLLRTRR